MFKKWFYGIIASLLVLITLGAEVAPAFAKPLNPNLVIIVRKKVKTKVGKPVTITIGKGGVFMPVVPFNGYVELDNVQLSSLPKPSNVLVWSGGFQWSVTDLQGKPVMYNGNGATVFFNLQAGFEQRAFKDHRAVIYYWTDGMWSALRTFSAKGGARAAAISKGLGVYALALTK